MNSRFVRVALAVVLMVLVSVLLVRRGSGPSVPTSGGGAAAATGHVRPALAGRGLDGGVAGEAEELKPAADFGAWASEKVRPPDRAKLDAFQDWIGRWKAATPEQRAGMVEEGELLARERRAEFKALIASETVKWRELIKDMDIKAD